MCKCVAAIDTMIAKATAATAAMTARQDKNLAADVLRFTANTFEFSVTGASGCAFEFEIVMSIRAKRNKLVASDWNL
jgi:hypothetical protein